MFILRLRTEFLIVHCSATKADQDISAKTIDAWHRAKGWAGIGYHFVIRLDGSVEAGRPMNTVGAHTERFNPRSVGICMVGGVGNDGKAYATFTNAQYAALLKNLQNLRIKYPKASIRGHMDFSPDLNNDGKITPNEYMKECPSFDVEEWCNQNKLDPL